MKQIKVSLCQQKQMGLRRIGNFLHNLLNSKAEEKPDFVIFPENFVHRFPDVIDIRRNKYLRQVSEIVKKYGIYLILGTMIEYREETHTYHKTTVVFNRNGEILGIYRKQKIHLKLQKQKIKISPGKELGIFQTDCCKIGVLICIDSEVDTYLNETLKELPKIVFIPIEIKLPTYLKNNLDMIQTSRSTAFNIMSNRFSKYAKQFNVTFIRVDKPYHVHNNGINYGTSLIITPNKIIKALTMHETTFSIIL